MLEAQAELHVYDAQMNRISQSQLFDVTSR